MARSKSTARWLKEHFSDPYVKLAQKEGYRSRASYKLLEVQNKDNLLKPGMKVVDLGSAPGGWSQIVANFVKDQGAVVASDILPMEPIPGVTFVQGDFTEQEVLDELLKIIDYKKFDLVISDMAPNMSGMSCVDQPKAMYLCELTLDLANRILTPGGSLLVKVFHGEGFDEYFKSLRACFGKVVSRKPQASRARSKEVYLLARDFKAS